MKRKVIQIADSTQLISLPRKWAIKYKIKKGDELDVEPDGNKLVIATTHETSIPRCSLNFINQPKLKRRSLCAAYLKGYDEVEIIYDHPEYIREIQNVLTEFIGYDIVKQDKNSCLVKQISRPTVEEFSNIFNRLFLLIHDTLQTIIDAIKNKDFEQLKGIPFREININKYSNFCRRLINKGSHSIPEQTSSLYFILMSLEFLGDEYKTLSKHFLEEQKITKQFMTVLEQTNSLFENTHKVFRTKNKEKAVENALLYDKLLKDVEEMFGESKNCIHCYRISRILQIIIQIQEVMLLLIV